MNRLLRVCGMVLCCCPTLWAAEKSATWTIGNGGAASREGDVFDDVQSGDVQKIAFKTSGRVKAITDAKVQRFSRSTHWIGGKGGFSNTVRANDNPGRYESRFFGTYSVDAKGGGGGGDEKEQTWSFYDHIKITKPDEHVEETTDDIDNPVEFLYGDDPKTKDIDYHGETIQEVFDIMPRHPGSCVFSVYYTRGSVSKKYLEVKSKTLKNQV